VSLTDRDKKIVFLLLPLVLVGAFWFLLLKPKRQEATKLSDQVTQAQEARDAAVSQANQLQAAKARYASQYGEMVRLGKALPTKVDMPSLLVQLNAAAKGTGIQFGAITAGARAAAAPIMSSTLPNSNGSGAATAFGAAVQHARAANAAETSSAAQSAAASNAVGTTGATGVGGLAYMCAIVMRMRRQNDYRMDIEDRIFHVVVPIIGYGVLVIGHPRALPTFPVGGGMIPADAGMRMQMDMPRHGGTVGSSSP